MEHTLKEQRDCIEKFIENIDTELKRYLQMDKKFSYGLVTRQHQYNGKIQNVNTNPLIPTEGEVALWDDKYSIVWFHRINSVGMVNTANGSYGRSPASVREKVEADLIVWSSVIYDWLGQHHTQSQPQLYRKIISILLQKTVAVVTNTEYDMPAITQSEFMENQVHKESLLLKFNYSFSYNVPKECYCLPDPNDCYYERNG